MSEERNYWRMAAQKAKMDGPTLGPAELAYLSTLPDSELLKIERVKEIQGQVAQLESSLQMASQESALAEGLDLNYSDTVKGMQKLGVGVNMQVRQLFNLAVIRGNGIMGGGRLMNRREPLPFLVQVAIVVLGVLTLAVGIAVASNAPLGVAMTAAPYGVPNYVFLGAIFVIALLYVRQRNRPQR